MSLVQLPKSTIRLLGSTQVITTVSSVVKELMENSFDAGATNIEIRLEKHGLEKIEVKDDGCGIRVEDCLCMALPHYTSKITDFSDLEKVQSYGFRGEALYSLCTVASITVTTKTADDEMARCYELDSCGQVIVSKLTHGLQGTTVTVNNLFKNLPVRKQVMSNGKRVNEELKKVENVVKSLAVIHPRVRVTLAHNKFLIWQKTSVGHLKLSVMQTIPHNIARQLHLIRFNQDELKFELLVPKRDCDVKTVCSGLVAESYYIFINKRPVRDKKIEKVISEIYFQYFGTYLPPNKWPICFIALSVPPQILDVNLEPNKTRIFINDQDSLLNHLKEQLGLYYCKAEDSKDKSCEIDTNKTKRKRKAEEQIDLLLPPIFPRKEVKSDDNGEHSCSLLEENVCSSLTSHQNETLVAEIMSSDSAGSLNDFISSTPTDLKIGMNGKLGITEQNLVEMKVSSDLTNSLKTTSSFESLPSSFEMGDFVETVVNTASSPGSSQSSFIGDSKKTVISQNELSLSQWSKGIMLAGNKPIQGSCVMKPSLFNCEATEWVDEDLSCTNLISKESSNKKCEGVTHTVEENLNPAINFKTETGSLLSKNINKIVEIVNDNVGVEKPSLDGNNMDDSMKEESFTAERKNSSFFSNHATNKDKCKLVDSDDVMERSVSSQMGRKEMSAFTKFAREMRSEILKEAPGTSFTTVASILAKKWRNLHEDERDKYVKVPSNNKTPPNSNKTIQRIDKLIMSKSKSPTVIERKSVSVNVALGAINKLLFDGRPDKDSGSGFNIIGQIESSDLWAYSRKIIDENKTEIGVISTLHLNEAYKFKQNIDLMIIPIKVLEEPIQITESVLGEDLWKILTSLESNLDIEANVKTVCDNRIIMNGFRISLLDGECSNDVCASLTGVALNINFYGIEDLRETLDLIKQFGIDCTVAQSRCLNALKYIRSETVRQCAQSIELKNKSSILQVLNLWLNESKCNECPPMKQVYRKIHTAQD